ncbi:unnamed protein product [Meloidogyne enterolobii]|uniref:Uncharacterized protein n=1 Tax=Meloidogyne enterolobii TaxID=390850 RepID=A0ACB0Y307_MELEN
MADDAIAITKLLDSHELLKKWKTSGKKFLSQINMWESMTPEQLQRRRELIEECTRKKGKSAIGLDNLWINNNSQIGGTHF